MGLTSAGFLLDRVLSLSLGADEQHRTTSDTPLDEEIDGPFEKPESGAEVDDVDAVSLSENERFHFRIPAPCLMPEMNTGVQQLLDRNGTHRFLPWLPLGKLEPLARPGLSVFLPFLDPLIASEQAGLLERRTEFGIELEQRTGYSQPDGTGLPRISAALDVDVHVELVVVLRLRQRLQNHNLLCAVAEVLLEIDVIDDDLPFPKASGTREQ